MAVAAEAGDETRLAFKAVLVGDGKVGKTALVTRWARDRFIDVYQPTVAPAITTKEVSTIPVADGEVILDCAPMRLEVWDQGFGQSEAGEGVLSEHATDAQVALLLYDASDASSVNSLAYWHEEVSSFARQDVLFVVVGCKSDLSTQDSESCLRLAHEFCNLVGAEHHFSISARNGDNVAELFVAVAQSLRRQYAERELPGARLRIVDLEAQTRGLEQENAEINERMDKDGAQFLEALFSLEAEVEDLKEQNQALREPLAGKPNHENGPESQDTKGVPNGEGSPSRTVEELLSENSELRLQQTALLEEFDSFTQEKEEELRSALEECKRIDKLLKEQAATHSERIEYVQNERDEMITIMSHEIEELRNEREQLQEERSDMVEKHAQQLNQAQQKMIKTRARQQKEEEDIDRPTTFAEMIVCCVQRH